VPDDAATPAEAGPEPKPAVGRWVDEPVLPELPPPPAHLIRVEGAQLIRVLNVEAHNPPSRGGYTEAVVLATAPLADGGTGALVAWLGGWQEGHRTTGRGRYAWCRRLEDRVREVDPPQRRIEGAEWHGHHELSEFAAAVRQAAELLPEEMRADALTPKRAPGSGGDNGPEPAERSTT
jgi:hypothetical protein